VVERHSPAVLTRGERKSSQRVVGQVGPTDVLDAKAKKNAFSLLGIKLQSSSP
jgi:hypothetical protein